jgi:hypothetical protein
MDLDWQLWEWPPRTLAELNEDESAYRIDSIVRFA